MKKLFFLCLFFQVVVLAQTKTISSLNSFKELEVTSGLVITLVKSDENKVEIKGKKAEQIVAQISNEVLKIGLPFSVKPDENTVNRETTATIFYKEDILSITADNRSIIKGKDIQQSTITCSTKERSIIELDIIVDKVIVFATSGGIITLTGSANNQEVTTDLYGIYEGFDLIVKGDTKVTAKSGAKAEI